jgi:hypothetical protein
MRTSTVTESQAQGPFRVVLICPQYCAITDGLLGWKAYEDQARVYFETYGGAYKRMRVLCPEEDLDYYCEILDSLNRSVYPDPPPAPEPSDDFLF